MNKLILVFMLLATIKSNGQKNRLKNYVQDTTTHSFYFTPSPPISYYVRVINDTIYIETVGSLKAIKIGDRVYKIESPTLKEVNKSDSRYFHSTLTHK